MKKIITKPYKLIVVILFLLIVLISLSYRLRVTEYMISSNKLPSNFDGYEIVQISDLHCKNFGNNQNKLIKKIKNESPQLIVLTGDIFDSKRWNYASIKEFLEGIVKIAPVYAITGNHEYDDALMFKVLLQLYEEYDVILLNDESVQINRGEEHINLFGMYYREYISSTSNILEGNISEFNVFLYHDPTQFDKLLYKNFNLILAGHTHGGVIRLPFLGGLIGTSKDFFPKYDYGHFKEAETEMIISAGLGNADIPRVFNRPEIVKIILKKGI